MANPRSGNTRTPEFRGSFVHLIEKDEKGRYSMVMLFPKKTANWAADLPWLAGLCKEVILQVYPGGTNVPPALTTPGFGKPWPIRDGDQPSASGNIQEAHKGHWVVSCGSKMFNPTKNLLNGVTNEVGLMTTSDCFSGCYFEAIVNVYWYNVDNSFGLSCGLENARYTRAGESLGGAAGTDAGSAFGVEVTASNAAGAFGETPPQAEAKGVPSFLD